VGNRISSFYLLSVGLLIGIAFNLINHHKPQTTFWGVVISFISIVVMVWLMNAKKKVVIVANKCEQT